MVLALGAVRATGALGNAHSILGFGFAAVGGLGRRYPIRILLGDGSIARFPVDGSGRAVGALGCTRSIPGLGCTAVRGLSGGYPIRILVGDCGVARIRVDSSGRLTILANGLTAQVLDAVLLRKHARSKQRACQQR